MKTNENRTILRSPTVVLAHEVAHAEEHARDPKQYRSDTKPTGDNYDTEADKKVITGVEQTTARALGEISGEQVTRSSHGGYNGPNVSGLSPEQQSMKASRFNTPLYRINNYPMDKARTNL